MIKFLLIVGIEICGVSCGVIIHNHFLNRLQFFKDFEKACKNIVGEIAFLKTDKFTLLSKLDFHSKNTKEFRDKYIMYGKGFSNILNENENIFFNEFLDSIGSNNVDGEVYNLGYYERLIKEYISTSQEKYNKYGVLAIKLSIIISALLVIILI